MCILEQFTSCVMHLVRFLRVMYAAPHGEGNAPADTADAARYHSLSRGACTGSETLLRVQRRYMTYYDICSLDIQDIDQARDCTVVLAHA